MTLIGVVPRRCVNLPAGSLRTLIRCIREEEVQDGSALEEFHREFGNWLGAPYIFGASSGRGAFQLALQALDLEEGAEIIFPAFTFPVIPMVAKVLGYKPVFCPVDPETYNSGPEHIEPKITDKTRAVLATHLFGQPCPIQDVVELAGKRDIRVIEDCAHACGVRLGDQQVGTFGDIGVFSFAEGKNMPCFGGGAIATADEKIARRATQLLSSAPIPSKSTLIKNASSIWGKWLLTRPIIFGLTAYQVLRLKLLLNQPLMDSTVGNELLEHFTETDPQISRLANLQAAVGLLQLQHIDGFNDGARLNARVLTEELGNVPGVKAPRAIEGDHIYVYYPLTVAPERRDDLRHYLLKNGIDTKTTDMADCSYLKPFREEKAIGDGQYGPSEASILEICVYPVISQEKMRRIARIIRAWAGLPEIGAPNIESNDSC